MARLHSTERAWAVIILLILIGAGCKELSERLFPPEPIRVPDLIGKPLPEALSRAEELGMKTSTQGLIGNDCPDHKKCVIVRMVPSPGATIPPEITVQMRYITERQAKFYREHRRMPRVIGWSEERVRSLFDPVWRTVTTEREESKAVRPGVDRVIRQSPKPGARLRVGQEVKIVIGYNLDYGSSSSSGSGGSGGSGGAGGSGRVYLDGRVGVDLPNFNPCRRTRWC